MTTFQGFDELDRLLRTLPNRMAGDLQGALVRSAIDAKREVVKRSNMSETGKRAIRARDGIVRIRPATRVVPKRLDDVFLEFYSDWKGTDGPPEEGFARQIEKEVGEDRYTPKRARRLLIPVGDFVTASGRPRRTGRGPGSRKVDIAKLPGTRVVPLGRGRLIIVQDLVAGDRGQSERTKGVRKSKLGERSRVVGILVPSAEIRTTLDFFGAWDAAEPSRRRHLERVLEKAVRG